MNSIAFSCIVDRPRYLMAQCFVWVNCMLEIQKLPPASLFVHVTAVADPEFLTWLESLGVNVVQVPAFDSRSPHCNKICQLRSFAERKFDQVVLMDCDTAWIGDAPFLRGEPVAGKIVDNARPSESVLTALFRAAGLGEPDWIEVSIPKGEDYRRSDRNNFNGGLYILDGQLATKLDPLWRKWATWCLDRRDSFGVSDSDGQLSRVDTSMAFPRVEPRALACDQVSFALALRELGISGAQLPIEWNYPTYSPTLPNVTPQILHYSRHFKPPFKLRKTGISRPDQAIDALNVRIEEFLGKHSARWVTNPERANWTRQVFGFLRGGSSSTLIE